MNKFKLIWGMCFFLFLFVGCGGGGGGGSDHPEGLPGSGDDSEDNFHPSGWASDPQHGQDYLSNPQNCRACHGDNLGGGSSGISCLACHHSFVEIYCEGCHEDTDMNSHGTHTQGTAKGPEAMGCADCHFGTDKALISGACDECHSPGGAFDGVQMGLDSWDNVYQADGKTLRAGQGNWCLSCHDDDPNTSGVNESSWINGVYAPNIAGDENNGSTYGFNITGHKVGCLSCHVSTKQHIDGEHRTYEVKNDGEASQFVPDANAYVDGYRLGDGSSLVPSPVRTALKVADYALCFQCHNPDEVLGFELDQEDTSHTNFWDNSPRVTSIGNAHNYHLRVGGRTGDTDWDGLVDSWPNCVTCHNVHGSPTKMLRHGELISTPGTVDKVPALDFSYVKTQTDSSLVVIPDLSLLLVDSEGGWTQYGSGKLSSNHVCSACHNEDLAQYLRTPKLWPKVLATPGAVANGETGRLLIAVTIDDPDDNVRSVVVNLSSIGGSSNQTMYDDGSNGDKVADDDVYSYQLNIAGDAAEVFYRFGITATDEDGNVGTVEVTMNDTDDLPGEGDDSEESFHPSGWASDPQHGQDYLSNPQNCRVCHGDNLGGGSSGISCVACHHSFEEANCEGCHDAIDMNSHGTHTQGTAKGPEAMGCADCHFGTDKALISGACDECHSPGGAFDGVQMGLDSWDNVYQADGKTLRAGQGNWCLSCHDDDPNTSGVNESSWINGVYAPNIAGDENNGSTYGFNITGHKIGCLSCHVSTKEHIDGEHRTYEVENDGLGSQSILNPYEDGYRLKDGSLQIPAPPAVGIDITDYSLCFECHNSDEVLGDNVDDSDVSHTNFWDDAPQVTSIGNAHTYHLEVEGLRGDTDWDGIEDARETCVTCHNVHGSKTKMLRYGELISTPGTTDKVPALNFSYVVASTDPATAIWTSPPLDAGDYEVQVHIPSDVLNNHAGDAGYTVSHDGGADVEATVDQRIDGGVWVSLGMDFSYNQDSTGTVGLDNNFSIGKWLLADAVRWIGGTTYTVDNPSAALAPPEDWFTWDQDPGIWNFIGDDFRYTGRPTPNPDSSVTLVDSVGGWTQYGSGALSENYICRACHNQGPALYQRIPKSWPKVFTTPGPVPATVPNDGTGFSTITVRVSDPDGNNNVDTVTIDLSSIGGGVAEPMVLNGDGTYSYTLNISAGTVAGDYTFDITATDLDTNTGTNAVTLSVN